MLGGAPAPTTDGSEQETFNGPRTRSNMILQPDGRNYMTWKTVMPSILAGEMYAWEATTGTLVPPDDKTKDTPEGKKQAKNYTIGNRNAKCILTNAIHPNIAVQLYFDDAETIEAAEIWRRIKSKFLATTGGRRESAISAFMKFKFTQSQTVSNNLNSFKNLL